MTADMTYHCSVCDLYWWPYQTKAGQCKQCGGGTTVSNEGASEEAADVFRKLRESQNAADSALRDAQDSRDVHEAFENYYVKRAQEHDAALPHEQDDLEDQGNMPTREHP